MSSRVNGLGSKLFVGILMAVVGAFMGVLLTLSTLGAAYSSRIAVIDSRLDGQTQRMERQDAQIDLLATKLELITTAAALQQRIDDMRRQLDPPQ